jgi:hypothetical protein
MVHITLQMFVNQVLHGSDNFPNKVPAKTSGYMDWLVKEAIGIKLHLNNVNREEGSKFNKAWNFNNLHPEPSHYTWNPSTKLLGHSNTHVRKISWRQHRTTQFDFTLLLHSTAIAWDNLTDWYIYQWRMVIHHSDPTDVDRDLWNTGS